MVSRRKWLTAVGCSIPTTLAGCTSSDDDGNDGNDGGDGDDSAANDGGGRETIDTFSDAYTIREDAYKGINFEVEQDSTIEWDAIVRTEFAVDIIVLTQAELAHFENEERFEYLSDATRLDTVGADVSATVPEGEYALIVDNSDMGEATPPTNLDDDLADVEIEGGLYA